MRNLIQHTAVMACLAAGLFACTKADNNFKPGITIEKPVFHADMRFENNPDFIKVNGDSMVLESGTSNLDNVQVSNIPHSPVDSPRTCDFVSELWDVASPASSYRFRMSLNMPGMPKHTLMDDSIRQFKFSFANSHQYRKCVTIEFYDKRGYHYTTNGPDDKMNDLSGFTVENAMVYDSSIQVSDYARYKVSSTFNCNVYCDKDKSTVHIVGRAVLAF